MIYLTCFEMHAEWISFMSDSTAFRAQTMFAACTRYKSHSSLLPCECYYYMVRVLMWQQGRVSFYLLNQRSWKHNLKKKRESVGHISSTVSQGTVSQFPHPNSFSVYTYNKSVVCLHVNSFRLAQPLHIYSRLHIQSLLHNLTQIMLHLRLYIYIYIIFFFEKCANVHLMKWESIYLLYKHVQCAFFFRYLL